MYNPMNVDIHKSTTQATRYEPSQTVYQVVCEAFPGTPCPYVHAKTLDEARELAAQCGFSGILL